MPTLDVDAIFLPTRELDADTTALFAGRQEILLAALSYLGRPEGCVAIFGERGVGKSSIGRILMGLLDGRIAPATVGLGSEQEVPRRACIRHPWTVGVQSLESLLYRLFDPTREDELAFARKFPAIVEKYRKKFEQISLKELTMENSSSDGRLGPNQVLVHDMFATIEDAYFAAAKRAEKGVPSSPVSEDGVSTGLVIVIDEMDQAKQRGQAVGLGSLIKNSRFQFITIGIGSAITDILEDHLSAERRFAGGQFLIETLNTLEVRELFARSSAQAATQGAKLCFADGFCDLVAEDFSGFPAQIQAFGLDIVINYQQRLQAGIEVNIRESDYIPLLRLRETSPNRDIRTMNDIDAGVDSSVARWEVLRTIVTMRSRENARWIPLDKLRRKVPARYLLRLQDNLKAFVRAGILKAEDAQATKVNIATPAVLCEIKRRIRQGWEPRSRLNK